MNERKLTRGGASQLTAALDKIANTVQKNPAVLGIDTKIAQDFAYRCDLISDAVETTATINYPKQAEAAVEEIGAETKGPIYEEDADPDLKGQFTQAEFSELTRLEDKDALGNAANSKVLASATALARLLEAAVAEEEDEDEAMDSDKEAASKLPEVYVRGYNGLMKQVRVLSELEDQINELNAQIDAAVGPLVSAKSKLSKEQKKIHTEIKKEYKDNLTKIGNVTVETKSKATRAAAMLKVAGRKGTMDSQFDALIAALEEKFEIEIQEFAKQTMETLRENNKTMTVSFKGFELEDKLADMGKTAGLADMLTKFQDWLVRSYKRMIRFINNAGQVAEAQGKDIDRAYNDLEKALQSRKASSPDMFALFI